MAVKKPQKILNVKLSPSSSVNFMAYFLFYYKRLLKTKCGIYPQFL